jgi:hypothetical protein
VGQISFQNQPNAICAHVVRKFFMRVWTTILLLTIWTVGYGQVTLGTGIVKIEFNEKTVVDFYKKPADKVQFKRIEFFDDKSINSWNIKNLEKEKAWLKPEVLWLDYSQFNFRCKSTNGDWLELIVNNDNGQTYWIKKNTTIKFLTWEEYLKDMFGVDRLEDYKQKIRKEPSDTAEEIKYEGRDCFEVKSLRGDWIEIFSTDHCDEGKNKDKIKSGWIKWRHGDKLMIEYHTTS